MVTTTWRRSVDSGPREAAVPAGQATAEGARKYNDANVLVMGLRLTSPEVAKEMLDAWFATDPDPSEKANIERLEPGA